MRDVLSHVLSSLVAAVSLLERGGKQAAPSDTMFEIMLDDYRKAIAAGRAALMESEPSAPTYTTCTYCTGTGMKPGSIVHACMRCQGTGKIEVVNQ